MRAGLRRSTRDGCFCLQRTNGRYAARGRRSSRRIAFAEPLDNDESHGLCGAGGSFSAHPRMLDTLSRTNWLACGGGDELRSDLRGRYWEWYPAGKFWPAQLSSYGMTEGPKYPVGLFSSSSIGFVRHLEVCRQFLCFGEPKRLVDSRSFGAGQGNCNSAPVSERNSAPNTGGSISTSREFS